MNNTIYWRAASGEADAGGPGPRRRGGSGALLEPGALVLEGLGEASLDGVELLPGLDAEIAQHGGLELVPADLLALDVADGVGEVDAVDDVARALRRLGRLVVEADGVDELLGEVPLARDEGADLGVVEADGEVLQQRGPDALLLARRA